MTSALDEKRRVTVPKEVADDLGLVVGSRVEFKRHGGIISIAKAGPADDLMETLHWNPKRTGRPRRVTEEDLKGIWG